MRVQASSGVSKTSSALGRRRWVVGIALMAFCMIGLISASRRGCGAQVVAIATAMEKV